MPKNKGKGGKNCKRGKNDHKTEKRELILKEDGQEYAQVTKMLGNDRLEAMCCDGVKRLCHIRGKLHKKEWISQGDIILIGLRDYQDAKADIILRYTDREARNLKEYGEFPESFKIDETFTFVDEGLDDEVEFKYNIDSEDKVYNKVIINGLEPEKNLLPAGINKMFKNLGVDMSEEHIKIRAIPSKGPSKLLEVTFTSPETRNMVLGKQKKTRIIDSEKIGLSGENRKVYISEKLSRDMMLIFNKTRDLKNFGYKSVWHMDNRVFCRKTYGSEIIEVTSGGQIEALKMKQ